MKGLIQWVTFHVDWYLDHRRAEWAIEERRGWIKYVRCSEDGLIWLHGDHATQIIDVLSWRRRPTILQEARP
jgi:hypothetical protein